MKILVVGCGSIGRRHITNLISLGYETIGVETNPEYRKWVEENLKIKTYPQFSDAITLEKASACWVCTPPNSHIQIAKEAIGAGLHTFIEKPVSSSLEGINGLIAMAKKKKLVLAVGYNLRFSKGVVKVKELVESGIIGRVLHARVSVGQYLPDWRPWQDYRKSYTASKSLGGGIILDASHEIDYIRWIMGEAKGVTCIARKVSSLEVETEDSADIICEFKSGAVANIHLDFIRRDPKRDCEIVGEKGTIELVFGQKVSLYTAESKQKQEFDVTDDHNNTYIRETEDFFRAVKEKKGPLVSAEEGMESLNLAIAAKQASEKGKTISL
ncbi:Gfo/Idh/MocA family oxidoreductase [Candidatus Micrarchaeota archaeon]|nr:Gfo/Idh/MocA family oxidoreductase [Candidatus Micrarchaeota archaeon]